MAFFIQYYSKKLFSQIKKRAPHLKKLHVDSFPAIHIKHMDWMDFLFKFSGELLVLILAVVVSGMNWHFFSANVYQDNSLAGNFLNNHSQLNRKLFAKNSSIVTVVSRNSFVPQAQAEDFVGLDAQGLEGQNYTNDGDGEIITGDESSLLAPNPDSVQSLIAKQVKIYQTQAGDNLPAIAKNFGISQQTIMWANNLTSTAIKSGWQLLILPSDGVLVKANSNTTLPDIAKKYSVAMEKIIAYNALDGAEDIEAGQIIIVPEGIMPTPPAAKPKPKPPVRNNDGKVKPEGVQKPQKVNNGTGHAFPWGYCTWYVATKAHVPWGGNAKAWLSNAKAYGSVITKTPHVGTILVSTESRYGHVAYVESVDDEGFTVSEMNYKKFGVVNTRWISKNSSAIRGFIHP